MSDLADLNIAPKSTAASRVTLEQLSDFLERECASYRPDLVILIERKGTAVYRAALDLKRSNGIETSLPSWERVVSSGALEAVSTERLAGRRVLVFDDMLRKGRQAAGIVEWLSAKGVLAGSNACEVRIAAFAAHEDANEIEPREGIHFPAAAYFRNLSTRAYREVRQQIVSALQQSGSLMLDTEHMEVRLTLQQPLTSLAHALSRSGHVVAFPSAAGRTNLTVFYDDSSRRDTDLRNLPAGSRLDGVVRKARVVERAAGEYALIPICLPDIPVQVDPEWNPEVDGRPVFPAGVFHSEDFESQFYAAALRASIDVLELALKDIAAAGAPIPCEVRHPTPGPPTGPGVGFDLMHLGVMYPTIDINALHDWVVFTAESAESKGSEIAAKRKPKMLSQPGSPSVEALERASIRLLQEIRYETDFRAVSMHEYALLGGEVDGLPRGVTLPEIMECGISAGMAPPMISACMDVLIDSALIVTRVEPLGDSLREQRIGRTYLPDGEVATNLVRDFTRRCGYVELGGNSVR